MGATRLRVGIPSVVSVSVCARRCRHVAMAGLLEGLFTRMHACSVSSCGFVRAPACPHDMLTVTALVVYVH